MNYTVSVFLSKAKQMTRKETDRLDKKKSSRKLQKTKFNIELWHLKSKVFFL